jgi:hypothetical protein
MRNCFKLGKRKKRHARITTAYAAEKYQQAPKVSVQQLGLPYLNAGVEDTQNLRCTPRVRLPGLKEAFARLAGNVGRCVVKISDKYASSPSTRCVDGPQNQYRRGKFTIGHNTNIIPSPAGSDSLRTKCGFTLKLPG